MALPVVAVVGRPNVGKSTLVNRIVGRREAIVEEHPGVTRDRKVLEAEWAGRQFRVVDTGGWMAEEQGLDAAVARQAERAMGEADVVLLVVDAVVGVTDEDERVASLLKRGLHKRGGNSGTSGTTSAPGHGPAVLLVANKVDSEHREADAWAFAALGLGDPFPLSALHGRNAGDLLDVVVSALPPPTAEETGDHHASGPSDEEGDGAFGEGEAAAAAVPAVAIVGRPNVGKSTLFNRLVGDERSVVHDIPGTTRDTVDTVVQTQEGPIRFVDTAGMRRKSRVGEGAEYYSLVRALQAIDRADVALLVIDATEGVTHQDQRLAERVDAAGSPIVIVLNKWETLDAERRAQVTAELADRLQFLAYAPVLKLSALTGKGVHKVVPAVALAVDAYHRRVPTRELNQVVQAAQAAHPAQGARVLYCTQGATDPPTFTLFTNRPLPPTYLRYLERRIREHFAFGPTPLKLRVRPRSG